MVRHYAYGIRCQGTEVRALLQVNECRERHVLQKYFMVVKCKVFPVVMDQQTALASHREASGKKSFLKASSHYTALLGLLAPWTEHKARGNVQTGQPFHHCTSLDAVDQLGVVRNYSCCNPGMVQKGRR